MTPLAWKVSLAKPVYFFLIAAAIQYCGAAEVIDRSTTAHEQLANLVTQLRRSDFEGARDEMKHEFDALNVFTADKTLAARARYWRGFAMWRRAINGFNDAIDRKELEQDLHNALAEFNQLGKEDAGYIEARIAMVSCMGYLMFMHGQDPTKATELLGQLAPLMTEIRKIAPDNPRWLWVSGPIFWNTPAAGGGQEKAIAAYEKGLDVVRKSKPSSDTLEPAWGEPELLMNLAWSQLNRTAPDLDVAEQNAHEALKLIPYWHYVRDILLPQITKAKASQ